MNILDTFGKELYSVELKTTFNLEIGGRTFAPGETVLQFPIVCSYQFLMNRKLREAHVVDMETQNLYHGMIQMEQPFICEKGVASQLSMAIMANSKLVEKLPNTATIPFSETLESDVDGELILKFNALDNKFFIHAPDGTIPTYTKTYNSGTDKTTITGLTAYTTYTISYLFTYTGDSNILNIGQRLFNGYLELTARMRLKDDTTGTDTTGILIIPTVRLVSDLSMRLGDKCHSCSFYV